MIRFSLAWMAMLSLTAAATARAAESLDDVSRHLDDLARQYRTIQYKVLVTSETTVDGRTIRGTQGVMHEVLRLPDGRALTRYQARGQAGGQGDQVAETINLSIYDGQYLYDLRQTPQGTYAFKSKPDHNPHDPIGQLRVAREKFDARLLPDRVFEGKEIYAIEFRPKGSEPGSPSRRTVSYTDRKTGLPVKTISYDEAGKVVSTAAVIEVKVNEDIPRDHFVFQAPPGVEVQDLTAKSASSSQPAAGTRPAPGSAPAK